MTDASSTGNTRQRLLLTALKLYAREGLHGVSLRRISAEAGSKNSAAMHYHFNNKLGVIEALVTMIATELAAAAARLAAREPTPVTLNDHFRATLSPLLELARDKPWGTDAVQFMSRALAENDPDIAAVTNPVYARFWQRVDTKLAEVLPGLPTEVRQLRLMFMSVNVFHGMAEVASLAHTPLGDLSHFDDDDLLDQLVSYLIGGLRAPANPETHSSHKEAH